MSAKVFACGPESLRVLPDAMQSMLHQQMNEGVEFLVGDRCGADVLIQRTLAANRYPHVVVYTAKDSVKHNLGGWKVCPVESLHCTRRVDRFGGPSLFSEAHRAMVLDADFAIIVWSGRSYSAFLDIIGMSTFEKQAFAIATNREKSQSEHLPADVIRIDSLDDVHGILPKRNESHRCAKAPIPFNEKTRALDMFMPSRSMTSELRCRPLYKSEIIDLVLGSPTSLDEKLAFFEAGSYMDDMFHECVDEVAHVLEKGPVGDNLQKIEIPELAWRRVCRNSFSTHRDEVRKAINALHSEGPDELIYRKSVWDEQPELYEEHELGIAPFSSFEDALDDLRFEMKAEEWDDDAPCWTIFEKWRRVEDGSWSKPYTYYAIKDKVVFFDKNRYDEDGRFWATSDRTYGGDSVGLLNLHVPFKPGDIVTLDCRPFAPLRYGLIVDAEKEGCTDCCFPTVMTRAADHADKDFWTCSSVKHGGGLHISWPGYSLLYHLETYDGPMPEDEQFFHEVQEWLSANPDMGSKLDDALLYDMTTEEIRAFVKAATKGLSVGTSIENGDADFPDETGGRSR